MTYRDDIEGLDAAILMHPRTWDASGHTSSFTDPMIDNKQSKARYRADTLIEEHITKLNKKKKYDRAEELQKRLDTAEKPEDYYAIIVDEGITDPVSGTKEWTEVRYFNLMFKTFVGPVEDDSNAVYLRPETAQGIFVNFKNVLDSSRQKPPFGIAQIGKSFRNEINTKYFLFRTREFEQMEMQYFVSPDDKEKFYEYWREQRWNWFTSLGISESKLRWKNHEKLAHYADAATDIEYEFPFGWGEIEGIHSRTDFDLKRHQEFSGKKMEYVDTVNGSRFVPCVIETAVGATRSLMAFLCDAYEEETITDEATGKSETRTVLHFHPKIAPNKVAVFPLVKKDGMPEAAEKIYRNIQQEYKAQYDVSGAIGRRYRRQDEIGTPFCITVDGETVSDNTVTIRKRDSMEQIRISADSIMEFLRKELG
jgi:glycyl-tRNA synthetase